MPRFVGQRRKCRARFRKRLANSSACRLDACQQPAKRGADGRLRAMASDFAASRPIVISCGSSSRLSTSIDSSSIVVDSASRRPASHPVAAAAGRETDSTCIRAARCRACDADRPAGRPTPPDRAATTEYSATTSAIAAARAETFGKAARFRRPTPIRSPYGGLVMMQPYSALARSSANGRSCQWMSSATPACSA